MQKVYDILFINTKGEYDSTQLNAEGEVELDLLIASMREELEIDGIVEINEIGAVRYYVCGIGYDENDCVTDYERSFGDFDTEEEAQEKFDEAIREAEDNLEEFFLDNEPVSYWKIQLEACEETDEGIECFDVLDETDIYKN